MTFMCPTQQLSFTIFCSPTINIPHHLFWVETVRQLLTKNLISGCYLPNYAAVTAWLQTKVPPPLSTVPEYTPAGITWHAFLSLGALPFFWRTKHNPEIILLIKEEAIQGGCGTSLSQITENRLNLVFHCKNVGTVYLALQGKDVRTIALWSADFLSFLPFENL